jgi:hypothetical protein
MVVSPRRSRRAGVTLCFLLGLVAGCSNAAPTTFEVAGRVTWKGDPVPEGDIIFAAADGAPIEDHGQIKSGEYRFRAKPGKKRVRIYANRGTGKIDPVMHEEKREQYIPETYNTKTEIEVEVTPEGPNRWDFALTPKR